MNIKLIIAAIAGLIFSFQVQSEGAIKKFEVDGVAIGDDMEDVINKWQFVDMTSVEKISRNISLDKIGKGQAINAQNKWTEIAPATYELRKRLGGGYFASAYFDHNKKLIQFQNSKVYYKKFSMNELYKKVVDKYGPPMNVEIKSRINHGTIKIDTKGQDLTDVAEISLEFQNPQALFAVYINVSQYPDTTRLYFNSRQSPEKDIADNKEFKKLEDAANKILVKEYSADIDNLKNLGNIDDVSL